MLYRLAFCASFLMSSALLQAGDDGLSVKPNSAQSTPGKALALPGKQFTATHAWQSAHDLTVTIEYNLNPSDALLKNSLRFSVDTPTLTVVDWKSSTPATTVYDSTHTTEKLGYTGTGSLTVALRTTTDTLLTGTRAEQATLFMHYHLKNSDQPQEFTYQFNATQNDNEQLPAQTESIQDRAPQSVPATHIEDAGIFKTTIAWVIAKINALQELFSGMISEKSSALVSCFAIFFLGILMSLTPCIYPMIPITVGILQTTAGTSLLRNFLLAGSYTLGIATTFASMGLLVAAGGAHVGGLLGNVYFVLLFVAFLAYLAFSMLGFYDMHVPRFMQSNRDHSVNGSFPAAFLFGVISGSVASPCLSPGLALLLGIVGKLGSSLLGFAYLFVFGLGIGTPLLIIGTFSNSLNVIPRAGLWMMEVKKLFGIMLLAMCFSYLKAVVAWTVLLWIMGATLFLGGLFYITTIEKYHGTGMRWYKQIVGMVLLLAACLVFYQAFKATINPAESTAPLHCSTDYVQARAQALEEKKLLLVDFGASWCISCNEIEHKFFSNTTVIDALSTSVVIVKIDCTNPKAESCACLQEQFTIIGFPAMLIVEPQEQKVLARWGGELLGLTPEAFIELVQKQA